MSNRKANSLPAHFSDYHKEKRGRFVAAICVSWKIFSCILSHVTLVLLVVSYCFGGAYLFQHLERPYEIEVKREINNIRMNLTNKIWKFSDNASVLRENDWVANTKKDLANFEKQILTAIKTNGWDGDEDITKSQWTFAGSLFYSIIVITTIGYGHISPRTDWGKVNTIFYAIVGIPLMLLCLSNIGDIMASSFRFLYWRVCCFICTRSSARSRYQSRRWSSKAMKYSSRSQPLIYRQSMKSAGSKDINGMRYTKGMLHAYSDSDLRTIKPYPTDIDKQMYLENKLRESQSKSKQAGPAKMAYSSRNTIVDPMHNMNERFVKSMSQAPYYGGPFNYIGERHTVEREKNIFGLRNSMLEEDDMGASNYPPLKHTRSFRFRSQMQNSKHSRESKEYGPAEAAKGYTHHGQTQLKPITKYAMQNRAKSADPRSTIPPSNDEIYKKTPIIYNRYAIDCFSPALQPESEILNSMRSSSMSRVNSQRAHRNSKHSAKNVGQLNRKSSFEKSNRNFKSRSDLMDVPMRMHLHDKEIANNFNNYPFDPYNVDETYMGSFSKQSRLKRQQPEKLPPSPRIMSPMGISINRQIRNQPNNYSEDDMLYGDEWNENDMGMSPKERPVPIWLCVFLVISYILGGATLFAYWEEWSFLDSAYFCFITLTTIGFGDFVPAKGVKDESEQSIAYCSLYLLFGIALLAMSFNLVQEEFISSVKDIARTLGILKDDDNN